jgi:hypothetical protein
MSTLLWCHIYFLPSSHLYYSHVTTSSYENIDTNFLIFIQPKLEMCLSNLTLKPTHFVVLPMSVNGIAMSLLLSPGPNDSCPEYVRGLLLGLLCSSCFHIQSLIGTAVRQIYLKQDFYYVSSLSLGPSRSFRGFLWLQKVSISSS